MKNKGFTLMEIIVVIALLAVVGVGSTIVVVTINDKKENNLLIANEDKFQSAIDVYLANHPEVINNINNNVEGAIISLELLKNEGLINSDLKIDYENNYYVVTNQLLSKPDLDNSIIETECENSIALETIPSWIEGEDKSKVLYFCPKEECQECTECTVCDETTLISDPKIACNNGILSNDSLACKIINNANEAAKNCSGDNCHTSSKNSSVFLDSSYTTVSSSTKKYKEKKENFINKTFTSGNYTLYESYTFDETTGKYSVKSSGKTLNFTSQMNYLNNSQAECERWGFTILTECPYYTPTNWIDPEIKKIKDSGKTPIIQYNDEYYVIDANYKWEYSRSLRLQKLSKTEYIEKSLSVTEDDYGKSYYYRGDVKDNYVKFNNMCWRIVRIQGDGSVKLILSNKNGDCSSTAPYVNNDSAFYGTVAVSSRHGNDGVAGDGYINYDFGYGCWYESNDHYKDNFTTTGKSGDLKSLRLYLEEFFNSSNFDKTKLKKEQFCIGINNEDYKKWGSLVPSTKGALSDINNLKCGEEVAKTLPNYVAPITIEEAIFGGVSNVSTNTYLNLYNGTYYTLSPSSFIENIYYRGEINNTPIGEYSEYSSKGYVIEKGIYKDVYLGPECPNSDDDFKVIPTIVLNYDVKATGNGTVNDPYIVE